MADNEVSETYFGQSRLMLLDGFWMSAAFSPDPDFHIGVRDLQMGVDDVIITSFPKSGTAWLERIVSLIMTDLNTEEVDNKHLDQVSLMLERIGPKVLLQQKGPRLIKTHYPYSFLPCSFRQGKGKILYIARNPKDVSVSHFFFAKAIVACKLQLTFEEYFKQFIRGRVTFGPWCEHVKQYWEHRDDDNVKFLFYEDLQKDPHRVIREIASYLGKEFSDDEVAQLASASSFYSMKRNPNTNYEWLGKEGILDQNVSKYMRKGKIGDWTNFYSEEMSEEMDSIVDKVLSPLNIRFCYKQE